MHMQPRPTRTRTLENITGAIIRQEGKRIWTEAIKKERILLLG